MHKTLAYGCVIAGILQICKLCYQTPSQFFQKRSGRETKRRHDTITVTPFFSPPLSFPPSIWGSAEDLFFSKMLNSQILIRKKLMVHAVPAISTARAQLRYLHSKHSFPFKRCHGVCHTHANLLQGWKMLNVGGKQVPSFFHNLGRRGWGWND